MRSRPILSMCVRPIRGNPNMVGVLWATLGDFDRSWPSVRRIHPRIGRSIPGDLDGCNAPCTFARATRSREAQVSLGVDPSPQPLVCTRLSADLLRGLPAHFWETCHPLCVSSAGKDSATHRISRRSPKMLFARNLYKLVTVRPSGALSAPGRQARAQFGRKAARFWTSRGAEFLSSRRVLRFSSRYCSRTANCCFSPPSPSER